MERKIGEKFDYTITLEVVETPKGENSCHLCNISKCGFCIDTTTGVCGHKSRTDKKAVYFKKVSK